MKNIHVIATDNKPSRLYFNVNDKEFQICEIEKPSTILKPNRHIYITNDEDINENDYIITKDGRLVEVSYLLSKDLQGASKIILTTDSDLIKDGVQAINDEFLEWFVKNPSCEFVEVVNDIPYVPNPYEIIIPKEEPKQETLEEVAFTLAIESVKKYMKIFPDCNNTFDYRKGFEEGFIEHSKWQQEKSYSEEELKSAFKIGFNIGYGSPVQELDLKNEHCEKWFEQFKKK